jgi:hypothetical protein
MAHRVDRDETLGKRTGAYFSDWWHGFGDANWLKGAMISIGPLSPSRSLITAATLRSRALDAPASEAPDFPGR